MEESKIKIEKINIMCPNCGHEESKFKKLVPKESLIL
jgi:uncharacterized Zn finger protein